LELPDEKLIGGKLQQLSLSDAILVARIVNFFQGLISRETDLQQEVGYLRIATLHKAKVGSRGLPPDCIKFPSIKGGLNMPSTGED
jgi:hypothetical protein